MFSRYDTCASRTNIVVEQSFSQESILTPVERLDCVWGITIPTVHIQLDSVPHIPTMKTFSTLGNCSVTVSDLDLLRILFHGDSISDDYGAR